MKKLLLAVVGLVVIAVVLVVLLHRPETTPSAVTLLPDSTIALVDIPDFQSCRDKVAASPVARFCQEPEVRACLERQLAASLGGQPGSTNQVLCATNLIQTIWQPIATNLAGADGNWQFTDTNTASSTMQFYRSQTQ